MEAARRPEAVEDEVEVAARKEEWTEDDARLLLKAQKGSGMTMEDFAKQHGFIPQRLHRWKTKLRQREKAPKNPFVPVRLVGPREATGGKLEVVLGGGRMIRVGADFDAGLLQKVVATLEGMPC